MKVCDEVNRAGVGAVEEHCGGVGALAHSLSLSSHTLLPLYIPPSSLLFISFEHNFYAAALQNTLSCFSP